MLTLPDLPSQSRSCLVATYCHEFAEATRTLALIGRILGKDQ